MIPPWKEDNDEEEKADETNFHVQEFLLLIIKMYDNSFMP